MIICFGGTTLLHASETTSSHNLKAAYLFNFLYFVEWPENTFKLPTTPYNICVIGDTIFANALKPLEAKQVHDHPIMITNLLEERELSSCHLLYITDSESSRLNKLLVNIKGQAILLVSDMLLFSSRGGVIGLIYEEGHLLFEINLTAAKKHNLKISAKLLELAQTIE